MSKVEDYARPLDAIEILVDEHALPGRLTPLGDVSDMRFVATPETVAMIEEALADGMREDASLSEMTAKVEALTPITCRDVRITIDGVGTIGGDDTHITEPTLIPGGVIDRRYVVEDGGSLHGPGWSTSPRLTPTERTALDDAHTVTMATGQLPELRPFWTPSGRTPDELAAKSKRGNR